jgi:hypothetical protein
LGFERMRFPSINIAAKKPTAMASSIHPPVMMVWKLRCFENELEFR